MQAFLHQAKKQLDRTAIISNKERFTYKEILLKSESLAIGLLNGKKDLKEDRIAFMIDPSFEYTVTQWGIWRAGGVAVPLCVVHPLESIQYVLEDADVSTLVVTSKYFEALQELAQHTNTNLIAYESINEKASALPLIDGDRAAMILYTSGTTSKPKGVVTTHDNISFCIRSLVDAWQWRKEDHILNILPLHHVHGIINVMSCALWVGATCEFLPKFDAEGVWDKFREGKINLFMAVPTIYYKLIRYWEQAEAQEQKEMSDSCRPFRLMVSGSAALPVPVLEQWKSITGQLLLERYGMTEIGMALSNPFDGERRPGHVGQALPGVDIRLMDEQGNLCAEGTQGEIQIKGPNVFKAYWQKPEPTKKAFTNDGWFKSGDIAILKDGYYQILGRNSVDIIKTGGYKVSALEIESVLLKHPKVDQVGVVGIPDEEWGEKVVASIVSKASVSGEELKVWLQDKLPKYKIPRKYLLLSDLPKNTLGKVTKNKIKEMF